MKEAIVEAFVIWESLWRPPSQLTPEVVRVWERALAGVSEQDFRRAAQEVVSELKFWPTPADIISRAKPKQDALPHYYNEFKALPMPQEPPITKEQKREILESMNPGARQMFVQMLYGDEEGRTKH